MNWDNLKLNKCPMCNKLFKIFNPLIKCVCGFQISPKKFTEILHNKCDRKVSKIKEEEDNQEALSNL